MMAMPPEILGPADPDLAGNDPTGFIQATTPPPRWWHGQEWIVLFAIPVAVGLIAVASPLPGWWDFLVGAMVVAMAHRALESHRCADRTSRQLVETLGTLPDLAGHAPTMASGAVRLAGHLADDLGLSRTERNMVTTAASCGQAGRVGLGDPAHPRPGFGDKEVARWSSAMLRCAPTLAPAAELVGAPLTGRRPEPAVSGGRAGSDRPDRSVHLRALVDVAAAFEQATTRMAMSPEDAVAVLRRTAPAVAAPVLDALAQRVSPDMRRM